MHLDTSIDTLMDEHRALATEMEGILDSTRDLRSSRRTRGDLLRGQWRARFSEFRVHLVAHFLHEENGLYGEIGKLLTTDEGSDVLRSFLTGEGKYDLKAHRAMTEQAEQIISSLEGIERSRKLGADELNRVQISVQELSNLLKGHVAAEDEMIFPTIRYNWDRRQHDPAGERILAHHR
jgi:hemerythrin-like domain-containing protein